MFRRRLTNLITLLAVAILTVGSSTSLVPAPSVQAAPDRILIRNAALVLTMDPALGEGQLGMLENADVLIAGERILAVGQGLPADGATVVDATGKIVMPGFVNTHDHLWQFLIRGCSNDEELILWLDECVFPFFQEPISGDDAYTGVRLATVDLISTGVTTVVDWSHAYSPEFVRGNLRALDESGLRFIYAYWGTRDPAVLDDIRRVKHEIIDPNPRARLHIATHPTPFFAEDVEVLADLARELDVWMDVHLLESPQQRADNPVEMLDAAGALGPNLLADHAVHLTDEEIALLAERGVRVAHNPISNMRLASGFMRLPEMQEAGVRVGLGLDGGTGDTSDFFNTMRIAVGIQRGRFLDPKIYPTVPDVLRMATLGGAEVLGMEDQIGSLTPGKQADVIIINPNMPNFGPRFNWLNQLVFSGQPRNVEWVFVAGRALMRDGKLVKVNSEKLMDDAQVAVQRVLAVLEPFLSR